MSRMSLYATNAQAYQRFGQTARQQLQQLGIVTPLHDSASLSQLGSSASSSLAIDLGGYDQAIQDLTESLNEVKITAALALQESQLVREQMQQGILSVLSELSAMWCQDICGANAAVSNAAAAAIGGLSAIGSPDFAVSSPSESATLGNASGGAEDQRTNFRYKTQLCKNYMAGGGRCTKGEACQYAHGNQELRRICEHPRYKTKMCSLQITLGVCPHGESCFFAHHPGEMRGKDY